MTRRGLKNVHVQCAGMLCNNRHLCLGTSTMTRRALEDMHVQACCATDTYACRARELSSHATTCLLL